MTKDQNDYAFDNSVNEDLTKTINNISIGDRVKIETLGRTVKGRLSTRYDNKIGVVIEYMVANDVILGKPSRDGYITFLYKQISGIEVLPQEKPKIVIDSHHTIEQ